MTVVLLLMLPSTMLAQSASLPLEQIIARMQAAESASRRSSVPYTVTRQYVLSDTDPRTPDSEITARIKFVPPVEQGYTLGNATGSGHVKTIVRKVLDQEAEMSSHADRAAITPSNYDFVLLGEERLEGHRCYLLQLKPRREAPELLQGRAWIDAETFRVRRLQGEPAKSPSWWVKDVHVSLEFGEVLGMWVQLAARADADVRWMGRHVLTSESLDFRSQTLTAQIPVSRRQSWRAIAETGSWVAR